MKSFFHYAALITCTILIWYTLSQVIINHSTSEIYQTAIQSDVILIGDSHAENIPWGESNSAFILPGSGLLHTYLVLKTLAANKNLTQKPTKIVATIWPGTFSTHQEGRYTGDFNDKWGSAIGGRISSIFSLHDYLSQDIPLYVKKQSFYGILQMNRSTTHRIGNNCSAEITQQSKLSVDQSIYPANWMEKAETSWWFFNQCNQIAESNKFQLIWVTTPTHPNFLNVCGDISTYFQAFPENAFVSHLNVLNVDSNKSGFIDYHHINCILAQPLRDTIMAFVSER